MYEQEWNYIVDRFHKNYNERENVIQKEWEELVQVVLGYKRYLGEVGTQRQIVIGSRQHIIPDIIITDGKKDLFDIELKQYNISLKEEMVLQLKSYLKQLNLAVGVIVCQKLYLCYYEYSNDNLIKLEIEFRENNQDGVKFIELLSKQNFSATQNAEKTIKEYILSKAKKEENVSKIKELVDRNYVLELIKNQLKNNYSTEEISEALKDKEFIIRDKIELRGQLPLPLPEKSNAGWAPKYKDFIIIKVSEERISFCKRDLGSTNPLYDATRHAWLADLNKTRKYRIVVSVATGSGVVREVYIADNWYYAKPWIGDEPKKMPGRVEFSGEIATEEIRNEFMGKTIPEKYRKKGMASPFLYSKEDINN